MAESFKRSTKPRLAKSNAKKKKADAPLATYASLIALALVDAPEQRLLLEDIYTFIEQYRLLVPASRHDNWRNSVRHNLSLRNCFVKEPRFNEEGKMLCAYWCVREDELPKLATQSIAELRQLQKIDAKTTVHDLLRAKLTQLKPEDPSVAAARQARKAQSKSKRSQRTRTSSSSSSSSSAVTSPASPSPKRSPTKRKVAAHDNDDDDLSGDDKQEAKRRNTDDGVSASCSFTTNFGFSDSNDSCFSSYRRSFSTSSSESSSAAEDSDDSSIPDSPFSLDAFLLRGRQAAQCSSSSSDADASLLHSAPAPGVSTVTALPGLELPGFDKAMSFGIGDQIHDSDQQASRGFDAMSLGTDILSLLDLENVIEPNSDAAAHSDCLLPQFVF